MHPNVDETPYEKHHLRPSMIVFNIVFNPENTLLIKDARSRNCKVVTGMEMFVRQASLQCKIFTDHEGPADLVEEVIRRAIGGIRCENHDPGVRRSTSEKIKEVPPLSPPDSSAPKASFPMLFLESPWPILIAGLVLETLLALAVFRTGRGLLWAMMGVGLVVLLGLAVEHFSVTDTKRIRQTLEAAAAGLVADDARQVDLASSMVRMATGLENLSAGHCRGPGSSSLRSATSM